jgi:hypothetical protein
MSESTGWAAAHAVAVAQDGNTHEPAWPALAHPDVATVRVHQTAHFGPPDGMTTTNDTRNRGHYQRVTDPEGTRYLLHAVPSGYLGFSVSMPQGAITAVIQTLGVKIVNRAFFRGGWTLPAWRSDVYAPKRERVHKERFACQADALAAFERTATTIREAGLR